MSKRLQIYDSAAGGQGFVSAINVPNWRRSIRSHGGYWQGRFSLSGAVADLTPIFYEWLGFHVVEKTGGSASWEGMIYEMELSHGGVKRRRSLDLMANYVSVYWVDPAREEHQTSWASQAQSIARYGRKEEIDWLDDMTEPAAEAQRDRMLAEYAWPWARPLSFSNPGLTELTVAACGYAFTANWRYTTQNSEFDTEQGALSYAATTFTDSGQDWADWETTSGDGAYSVWVTNSDNTLTWAYLGTKSSTTVATVWQDQGLTSAGWNGADPIAGSKTPSSYYVRGGASELISDIVTNDCEFLSVGRIDDNYVQVNRILQRDQRGWDVMMDAVDLGDTSGNPYRLYVQNDRNVIYEQIDTAPRYYLRSGSVYDSIGAQVAVDPRLVQPAVVRDMAYTMGRSEYGSWLSDARDIYVDEVQVDENDNLTMKTELYTEGDILAEITKQQTRYPHRPIPKEDG